MKKLIYSICRKRILRCLIPRILIYLSLVIILVMTSITPVLAAQDLIKYTSEKFRDINESDWYIGSVSKLVGLNIIDGYPDGTFKPEESINIDAFIKMIVTALGHELKNGKNYWAEPYIEKAKELELIKAGEFLDYTIKINRAEIARIIIRALEEEYHDNLVDYTYQIKDYGLIPDEFKDYVLKAYIKGIVTGYPDGGFGYNRNATRAEASTMLIRMLDESERKVPDKEEVSKRTKELTKEDIKRLKSYKCYKLTGDGKVSPTYKSFEDMYREEKSECEAIYNRFHPLKFNNYSGNPIYTDAEVKWISNPKLIYRTVTLDNAIRGIVQIKYSSDDNLYNLKANQWYECDAEYYYLYTVSKGRYISKFFHLSEWKPVK